MQSNTSKLILCLEQIIEQGLEAEVKTPPANASGGAAVKLLKIALNLLDSNEVKDQLERKKDFEFQVHRVRDALQPGSLASLSYKETLSEFLTYLNSDPDPNAYINDPIIKARIELLQRLTVDETNDTITFDGHTHDVSPDAAKLFSLARKEYPRLVVANQHNIRMDRLRLKPELERLLEKDGKFGVSIKLPNDCQNLA